MAESTALDTLLEMGFDRNRAEKALVNTGNQGIDRAMDWLMEHENDPDIDEPYVPPKGNVLGAGGTESTPPPDSSAEGNAEGSPEGQDKRPLTEEEKLEQVRRLEQLMREKQREREEREREAEVQREKERRRQGQELLQVRQRLQDEQMRKLAEERLREKMEDKMAKQRVRDKIARDRAERALKFGGGADSSSPPVEAVPSSSVPPVAQGAPPAKKDYDECRIQVRLLDGSALCAVFRCQEPLAAVRVYVQLNGGGPDEFSLLTPYPRRLFTEEDMEKPLTELGLVPSAVLVVAKK
ncbi:UBX domain-containing protein 1 [Amia ocellicauda]|uniref:UBX domain-containing protein 1 n=1 Tax=Amia ocellicauda TaxID=2972642 RepID=UPI003464B9FC|nr:UBXN1 protein [Amia calva]